MRDDRPVPEIFADGVLDVGFGNGVVRIDLFSLSAVNRDPAGQPVPEIRQRVVMSLPGFLASLATMEGMRKRLEDAGVLTPPPGTADKPAGTGGTAGDVPPPRSPNFR